MKLRTIKNINKKKWSKFVFDHPNGHIFQTPEMYDVFKNTKNYHPILIAITDDNDEIIGILLSVIQQEYGGIFKGFSSRCVAWGGPLLKNNLIEKEKKKY